MKLLIALIIKIQIFSLVSAEGFDFLSLASRNPCIQPPLTPDRNYTVKFTYKDDISEPRPGDVVPQFTIIVSQCNEGYAVDYHADSLIGNELPSVCTGNSWQPPVLKCKRICKNFRYFSNFNMTCYEYFGGPKISCSGLLLERAIVIPRCQQKFHPDIKVNYDYATCQENGQWDKAFFKCIPDCGQVSSGSVNLIAGGYPEKRGGAPWNVAIYSSEYSTDTPKFICGGTLINAEMIISAAHCFYDEVFHQNQDTRLFHAIVGKATRSFKIKDYPTTKTYRFKSIYFPETTYKGAVTNYASDIVIIQLPEKVSFSQDVHPACLYWDDRDRFNPGENVMGKLSGFGATENGSLASKLISANLPYISYGECLKKVREDFLGSISVDKFCAGNERGAGARTGDSGGGLVFMDSRTGLFHLRGVVSNKDLSMSSIATFTDVAQYISWILKMIEAVDRTKPECNCHPDGSVKDSVCSVRSGPCQCKVFVTGKECDTCKDGFWNLQADNTDGCVACGCSSVGAYSSACDKITGSCQCKPNVIGRQCDECADNIRVLGPDGCEEGPKWVKYANGDKCSNAIVGGTKLSSNESVYVSRHQINQHLLPGKLDTSAKLALIPYGNTEHQFSEYEVLCGGLVEWIGATYGKFPKGSVAGGINYGNVGAETLYVCRAGVGDGTMVPGKLHPSARLCYIPNGGKEHPRHIYEVLVQHNTTACECDPVGSISSTCKEPGKTCSCKTNVIGKNCDRCAHDTYNFGPNGCKEGPKWRKYSNGDKCSDAIAGGYMTPTNETLYIARHIVNNDNLLPGKMVASKKLAFIPWGYSEYSFSDYEVLCGGSTKWVKGSRGEFPPGAFAGGYDLYLETLYVCRVTLDDGSLVPGKLHPSQHVCFVPHGGKEQSRNDYEVLQVV